MIYCFASEETWLSTRDTLRKLKDIAQQIREPVGNELDTLWQHLHMWRPTESVCYNEFWNWITSILMRLIVRNPENQDLERLLEEIQQNNSIPEEYREIAKNMLEDMREHR